MRKFLIISGGVVFVLLLALGVYSLVTGTGSGSDSSVAKKFAEALIVDRDAAKAYEYTAESFREYTNQEKLERYTSRLEGKTSVDTKIIVENTEPIELPDNFPETTKTTLSFTTTDGDWKMEVTTYSTGDGVKVHYYKIYAARGEE